MDKRQFFIEAMQGAAYKHKEWIINVFTRMHPSYKPNLKVPYMLQTKEDSNSFFFEDPAAPGELIEIEGSDKNFQLLNLKERIILQPYDLPNVKVETDTIYGNVLVNGMLFVYPFGGKVDFMTGVMKPNRVEDAVVPRLVDNVPLGEKENDTDIYVHEYLKFCEATSALAGLTQLCAASASPKSMVVDPAILKRRDELLEEYKHQLTDPAILARIDTELSAMDKASFKGDPAEGFYIKNKAYDVSRKRMFVMVGAEMGFSESKDGVQPITKSLEEGLDMEQMPAMVNNLRSGIYNRGHETALGGESVKYFYRVFQNTAVIEPDCGTKGGLSWEITSDNHRTFISLYQGDSEFPQEKGFTAEDLKKLIGKRIIIRSPMLCKTKPPSFCAKCVGDALAANPTGLHIAASDVGSIFMNTFMKSMHGKALRTAYYDFETSIT